MFAPFFTYDLKKHGQGFSGFFIGFRSYSGAMLPESSDSISIIESLKAVCHKSTPHADNTNPANSIASGRQYYVFGPKYELRWLDKNLWILSDNSMHHKNLHWVGKDNTH